MPDRAEITRVVADCVRYWRETGVPRRAIEDMRAELEQHLLDAAADNRTPDQVLGGDPAGFAESWAAEYRKATTTVTWSDVTSGRVDSRRRQQRTAWAYTIGGAALVAGVIAGTQISGGGDNVENEVWRWVWTILAVVAAIAEIFTAGFFLLPIAIGAVGAAILAWFGVDPIAQWLVFFGVSAIAFAYLRRFAHHQDDDLPRVGANRWAGAHGVVTVDIVPISGTGMIRVEGEEWRATSDGGDIAAGTRVVVNEVRGSKMVVSPMSES
ncbi:MAG: NfeD family protein [Acidimicrobiia bacterium]|nr:NfeD family protein [Acidimicrobiia bacterium]MDH5292956.1 NfeD family protein [Acidimicrobiia bacterium]